MASKPTGDETPESRNVPAVEDNQNLLRLLRRHGPGVFRVVHKHLQRAIPKELLSVLAASGDIDVSTKEQIRPLVEDHLRPAASQLATSLVVSRVPELA